MLPDDRLRLRVRALTEILQAVALSLPPTTREHARMRAAERRRELAREVTDSETRDALLREYDALTAPLRGR